METVPLYVSVFFILTTALTFYLFYKAANHSKTLLVLLLIWLLVHMLLSLNGFYANTISLPPRLLLVLLPPLLLIFFVFITNRGKQYLNTLNLNYLTLLHIVRVPVELVLFWLFLYKAVPQLMTFEGRSLDILSGITAPFIYYFGFVKKKLNTKILLLWNVVCLLLLFNIVIHAILSAPFPFQQLAFEQPNIAVLYFPFIWLPGFIVPLVLFSHVVAIKRLWMMNKKTSVKELWQNTKLA